MSVWSFNVGEWTESYVFLRLLGQGRMYGATSDLVKDENIYIDIQEIIRNEKEGLLTFKRFLDDNISRVSINKDDVVLKIVTSSDLDEMGTVLYKNILSGGDSNGQKKRIITIPVVQNFLESLYLSSPKPTLSKEQEHEFGKKSDIIIKYKDSLDHVVSTQGFSIKSYLGSCPTLYNCSTTSQLIYEIVGCEEDKMYELNSIQSARDIFEIIKKEPSLNLEFSHVGSEIFEDNMLLCDSRMLDVLNYILLINIGYIGNLKSHSCVDIVDELCTMNPLEVRSPEYFYENVIKRFLFNSFGGMTASKPWNGRRDLTGGYIDVSKKGEILYYRAISDDVFESFLFKNTKLDNPDRGINCSISHKKGIMFLEGKTKDEIRNYTESGNKKGDWGYVFQKEGKFYISINFQIRFK